jgi:hypothetical protein
MAPEPPVARNLHLVQAEAIVDLLSLKGDDPMNSSSANPVLFAGEHSDYFNLLETTLIT